MYVLWFEGVVFSVLVEEWPLSAKEVFSRVERSFNQGVSYQAVHKVLSEFVKDGVFVKLDGKYSVSVSWVDSLSFFSSKLKQNLSSGKNVFPVPEKMVFSSVYEVDQFLCSFCRNLNPTKEDSIYLFWNHFWIPLFLSRQTYADMRDAIATTNLFCITPGNSVVDKWCAAFWDKAGMKEKTGVKLFLGTDLVIYKDLVIQIFYPQEIKDAIDEVYSSTKNVKDLDLDGFFKKVFEKKTRIPVLISKNKEVAEELSGMIRKLFEK